MVIIRAEGLVKSYGAQVVLNHLDVELQEKDRIGIIGRNGAGKTTLFKLLAGLESPDSGQLNIKRGLKIGYLAQMPEVQAHQTGMAVLKEAFEPLYKLDREMTQLGHELSHTNDKNAAAQLTEKLASLQEQFEWSGGYEIDQKIKRVCDGLGIKETLLSQCFEQMSGGEKTRMMLGRILLEAPDVLLLDEPTNHLDLEALTWLEGYLRQYNGAVLIVSHDREFLDQTVTQILSVEEGTAKLWQGNYTLYKQAYDSWLFNQMAIYKQQQKKIRAMEEAIRRFEDWGKRSDDPAMFAKARNMQKRIEKMDKIDKPGANDKAMGLTFKSDGRTGHLVFVLKNVTGGYDHQRLFNQLDLEVNYQDNAVLMGANGSGKTTLFQMLRGKMSPEAGTVTIGSNVKLGYLEQEVSFENEQMTVFEYFNDQTMIGEFVARGKLARFMFFTEDLTKPLQALSGGERVRLKLCLMMELGINVLLLDEPTNHMDIASREVLEMALESFKGTILMISHDRYFVKKLAGRLMFLEDGKIRIFEGTYEDWQSAEPTAQAKIETNRAEAIEGLKHDIAMASRHIDPLQRSRQNELRKAKQRLEVINPQLESLQRELEAVMEALSSMEQPYEKLMALTQQQEALEHQIEALGLEWLELTELLEL